MQSSRKGSGPTSPEVQEGGMENRVEEREPNDGLNRWMSSLDINRNTNTVFIPPPGSSPGSNSPVSLGRRQITTRRPRQLSADWAGVAALTFAPNEPTQLRKTS
ncbi:hypothetical protein NQZ68_034233 [Dissostichus eleginoides]|nr:hypothetical protein NQZ68_034233 [Dissostichus eleginoides]